MAVSSNDGRANMQLSHAGRAQVGGDLEGALKLLPDLQRNMQVFLSGAPVMAGTVPA